MTFAANVNLQLGANASRHERGAATAGYGCFLVLWVNAVFHRYFCLPQMVLRRWLRTTVCERSVRGTAPKIQGFPSDQFTIGPRNPSQPGPKRDLASQNMRAVRLQFPFASSRAAA